MKLPRIFMKNRLKHSVLVSGILVAGACAEQTGQHSVIEQPAPDLSTAGGDPSGLPTLEPQAGEAMSMAAMGGLVAMGGSGVAPAPAVNIDALTPMTAGTGGMAGTGGEQGIGGAMVTENCASTSVAAQDIMVIKPADIIFALDSSLSMNLEIGFVQENMNAFSQQIIDSGIDIRVIVIAGPNDMMFGGMQGMMQPTNEICVGTPLGSGNCPDDTNMPNYIHINETVGSNNALNKIIDTYPQWQQYLRPEATKSFVVVTDDDATDEPNNNAATFTESVAALDPDPTLFAEWTMNGVYCFTECEDAAAIGQVYMDLVAQTAGVGGDLCLQDFQPVFDALAQQIIENAGAEIACQWDFPAVPDGQTFSADLIEVQRTSPVSGTTTIPRVDSATDCDAQGGGWYYDDIGTPTQILACPSTCEAMQNDSGGMIDVVFGCEVVEGCVATESTTVENMVEGTDVVCEWALPEPPMGTDLDTDEVNVRFTNTAGVATELGKVPSAEECANFARGWYYDNEISPKTVLVCPDVCSQIQQGGVNTQVDILLGCKTKPAVVQ